MDRMLSKTAVGIYAVLFGTVMAVCILFNAVYTYNTVLQMGLVIVWFAVLAVLYLLFCKHRSFIIKNRYRVLLGALVSLFIIQMFISSQMVKHQMYDCGYMVNGAIAYVENGAKGLFEEKYSWYFHHYNAQFAQFMLVQRLLKIFKFIGFTDYYTVLFITGHLLFTATVRATFMFLDENYSPDVAIFSLLFFLMFVPVWFQSSIPYTDTFSVWAPACFLLFAARAERSTDKKKKLMYYLLAALLMAVGARVKITVVITLIAFFIQAVINRKSLKPLAYAALCGVMIMAVNIGFTHWEYADVKDRTRDAENLPVTHWFMMGLQGYGQYSPTDEWDVTGSVYGIQARKEKNIEVIRQRLSEMGPSGYLSLLYRKTSYTFGCGTATMSYNYAYMDDSVPINLMYEFVLENGRFYFAYNNLSQSFYIVLNLMGILGALAMLIRKDKDVQKFAPFVALIGFYIFMMLWESNCRQLVNQWSLYVMCASIGYSKLMHSIVKNK